MIARVLLIGAALAGCASPPRAQAGLEDTARTLQVQSPPAPPAYSPPNADMAQSFDDYVTGSAGQATLADFGFLPPPSS